MKTQFPVDSDSCVGLGVIDIPLDEADSGPEPLGLVEESVLLFAVQENGPGCYFTGSRSSFVGAHEVSNPVLPCPVSLGVSSKLLWVLAPLYQVSALLFCLRWRLSENVNEKGPAQLPACRWHYINVSSLVPLENSACDCAWGPVRSLPQGSPLHCEPT